VPSGNDCAHRISSSGRGVEVYKGRFVAEERVSNRHAHSRTFVQAKDVAEISGKAFEKRLLCGTRIAKYYREPVGPQNLKDSFSDACQVFRVVCFRLRLYELRVL